MKRNTFVIQLADVSKKYEIHHEKPTLVEQFVKGKNETFWALKNINLSIRKGERVGIIGHNGSGKTTLLKILAGVTTPTDGTVHTKGKVVSLIDLQAGFHPDLSGYQNIFLNGALLGLSKREIEGKMNTIIAFADLRQFIDAPLFTYSSGMMLRLGFAIALHADPDILLLDEYYSTGDIVFQKKSKAKLRELFKLGKTLIFTTHQRELLRKVCSRIIMLDKGSIVHDGGRAVIKQYERFGQKK